ncbi:unnamed protein product [Acidocella sp. C78]|nr:unnamed protein product [Acidocella sp. C78]
MLPRFETFIEALCAHIAAAGLKHGVAGPVIVLIWQRLRRLGARFARLAAIPARRRKTARAGSAGPRSPLPRRFAWLTRLIPGTASVAAQFRAMLETEEMAALVAATPQAGRILRPLCHTLGIRPPTCLRRPRAKPRAPKPRAPQPKPPEPPAPAHPAPNPLWSRAPGAARFNPPRRKFRA